MKVRSKQLKKQKKIHYLGKKGLTVEEARKKLRSSQDHTEENLQRLHLLSEGQVEADVANRILDRALKNKETDVEQVTEQSAFTEEDFEKFEQEYFVN